MIFRFISILMIFFSVSSYAESVVSNDVILTTSKVLHLVGEINPELFYRTTKELALTYSIPGDRLVVINSPGGELNAGQHLIDLMQIEKSKGVRYICVVVGEASSMAFNIFTKSCDVRLSTPDSNFLIHKTALSVVTSEDHRLTGAELRRIAKKIDEADEPYRQANAFALGMSLKEYDKMADRETTWDVGGLLIRGYLKGIGYVVK